MICVAFSDRWLSPRLHWSLPTSIVHWLLRRSNLVFNHVTTHTRVLVCSLKQFYFAFIVFVQSSTSEHVTWRQVSLESSLQPRFQDESQVLNLSLLKEIISLLLWKKLIFMRKFREWPISWKLGSGGRVCFRLFRDETKKMESLRLRLEKFCLVEKKQTIFIGMLTANFLCWVDKISWTRLPEVMGKAQGCRRRGGTKLEATVASTAVLIGVFIGATCKIRDGRENENYSALRQNFNERPYNVFSAR